MGCIALHKESETEIKDMESRSELPIEHLHQNSRQVRQHDTIGNPWESAFFERSEYTLESKTPNVVSLVKNMVW